MGREYTANTLLSYSSRFAQESSKAMPLVRVRRGPSLATPATLVVELDEARIRFPVGVDRSTLTTVLSALRGAR